MPAEYNGRRRKRREKTKIKVATTTSMHAENKKETTSSPRTEFQFQCPSGPPRSSPGGSVTSHLSCSDPAWSQHDMQAPLELNLRGAERLELRSPIHRSSDRAADAGCRSPCFIALCPGLVRHTAADRTWAWWFLTVARADACRDLLFSLFFSVRFLPLFALFPVVDRPQPAFPLFFSAAAMHFAMTSGSCPRCAHSSCIMQGWLKQESLG